jgi:branched-chain amino acid transport system substrate-binding protein
MSRSAKAIGLVAIGLLVLGTASLAQDKPAIKVGAVSSLSGGAVFADSAAAVKAYFDRVNAQGGIQGRKIEFYSEDDKNDPGVASQAARRLVDDIGVVAHVGSASVLECSANAAYYVQKGVISVTGTGVDPLCFTTPNISAVNAGPFVDTANTLWYATNYMKKEKICFVGFQLPGLEAGYKEVIAAWEKHTGKKLHNYAYDFKGGDDPAPFVLRAKSQGCDAVVFTGVEPMVVAWMQAVSAQGLLKSISWLFLTPPYTAEVAKALGSKGDGLIAAGEFEPWSGNSNALADWRNLLNANKIPLTSFGQGGYLAAEIFVNTLKGIKGEITRESVTAAFKNLKPYRTAIIGDPYTFGPGNAHNPNRSAKMMELRDGQWRLHYPGWIRYPWR